MCLQSLFALLFFFKYRLYEALFCVQTILLYGIVQVPDFKLSRMTLMYLVQLTVFIYSSFVLGMWLNWRTEPQTLFCVCVFVFPACI